MTWMAAGFLLGNLWVQHAQRLQGSDFWWPAWLSIALSVLLLGIQALLSLGLRHHSDRVPLPADAQRADDASLLSAQVVFHHHSLVHGQRVASLLLRGVMAWLLGMVWTWHAAQMRLQQDLAATLEGQDLWLTGHVTSLPETEVYGQRFQFAVDQPATGVPTLLELTWYSPEVPVRAAERWQLQVRLKRRHGFANPGGYDYEAQLLRDAVGATGYVRAAAPSLGMASGEWVLKARAALVARLVSTLPDHAMQGVVRGLAVGDQQAISSDQWQVFARTGITHLLAISGFHIGMVAWLCAALARCGLYWPSAQQRGWTAPSLQAVGGMSGALVYSLLAGMSVPTQRTLIMLAVYFGARCLRREVSIWHSYAVALLLVLWLDPFATLSVGLWLSFGAVAIILINQAGRLAEAPLWQSFLALQGVVTVGLTPLLLGTFGTVSLLAPLINLLAIPLVSLLLAPAVLIGCALLYLNATLAGHWLQAVAWLMQHGYAGLSWAADSSWATLYWPALPWWIMALLSVGTLMWIIPWLWPLRLAGVLLCGLSLCWRPAALPENTFRLTTLDVGQGLAVLIQTRSHTLLYDAGPVFQSGRDTGELVVLPSLRAMGIRQLSMVMASHGDADHVGGLDSVLHNMPAPLRRGPSVPERKRVLPHSDVCSAGQQWQWDGVQFEVLHPVLESLEVDDNDQSCVLRVSTGQGSALLLGDIEKRVERELVQRQLITPATVVIAAHHGSNSSSTSELIAASSPHYVVFSAGYRNRWNFPTAAVQERWVAQGSHPLNTATLGAISMLVAADGVQRLSCHRQQQHYWNAPVMLTDRCE